MWYEIIAFLVALGFLAFLKYGKGSLSIIKLPFPVGGARGSASISSLSEEDLAEKRMSWYVILAVISALVAKMFGYTPAGIIALVGVHIVWWRYRKKGSSLTKLVVYGMLTFFVLAWLYPVEATKTRDTGIKIFGNAVAGASNTAESLAKGDESKASVSAENPTSVRKVALTREWSKPFVSPPSGGMMRYGCTKTGSMMKIDFDSAKSTLVTPGQEVPCPILGQKNIFYGNGFVNARYYFQSDEGGELYIQDAV